MSKFIEDELDYLEEIRNYIAKNEILSEQESTEINSEIDDFIKDLKESDIKYKQFKEKRNGFRIGNKEIIEKFVRHNFHKVDVLLGYEGTTYFYYDVTDLGYFRFDIEEIQIQVGIALSRHPDFTGDLIDTVAEDALTRIKEYLVHPEFILRDISFYDNFLGGEDVLYIAESIKSKECPIRYLDVSNNSIGKKGGEALIEAALTPECNLIELDLQKNSLVKKDLSLFKKLKEIKPQFSLLI